MGIFGRKAVAPVSSSPAPPKKEFVRKKDHTWQIREDLFANDMEAVNGQLLMDIRDHLALLNKKIDKMDENFRLVFGVEDKDEG